MLQLSVPAKMQLRPIHVNVGICDAKAYLRNPLLHKSLAVSCFRSPNATQSTVYPQLPTLNSPFIAFFFTDLKHLKLVLSLLAASKSPYSIPPFVLSSIITLVCLPPHTYWRAVTAIYRRNPGARRDTTSSSSLGSSSTIRSAPSGRST